MTASSETSATAPPMVRWDDDVAEDVLWKRIVRLLDKRERVLIGIVGPPGAGKSTIAQAVVNTVEQHLPEQVALVPMDGYHLAESAIERLGLDDSKGGPETFDVFGYVALLERLRHADGEIVYAPKFRPDIDDSVPAAIPVNPDVRVVVTEGNYLLLDTPPWSMVRPLLDESWYIQVDEATRRERLIVRHIRFKADAATARTRALGPDQRNAELVEAARNRADLIIDYL